MTKAPLPSAEADNSSNTIKAPDARWPILAHKAPHAPSVFRPEALLRESRRQKGLPKVPVPAICILDPDGDIVRHLKRSEACQRHEAWACYHTELFTFRLDAAGQAGIIGCAVGAPFAVLLAEQLFASGCQLLVSVTSAGQILEHGPTPYFVLVDRALRDEGTSYHYLPPSTFSEAPDARLIRAVEDALAECVDIVVHRGATWTTDAPYRETETAIAAARAHGVLAVEMETAALYAYGTTHGKAVLCLAHVTNSMAQNEGDFDKGEAEGAVATLRVLEQSARAWQHLRGITPPNGQGG